MTPETDLPWRLYVAGGKHTPYTIEISAPPPAKLGERPCVVGWMGFDGSDLTGKQNLANALYIVHACNAYPRLVAEIERLSALQPAMVNGKKADHGNALLLELARGDIHHGGKHG